VFQVLDPGWGGSARIALRGAWGFSRHEFLVKKFERAPLQAVLSNRLRRFGRLHEFFWKLFLLSVRCPNQFLYRGGCERSEVRTASWDTTSLASID